MARRIGIFALVFVAVVGLLVSAALIFATSKTGSQMISDKIRSDVRRLSGLDVTFRDLDLDVLPPRIRLLSVQMNDDQGRLDCAVDEVELSPDPLALLSGVLSIQEVYLGQPACQLVLEAEDLDDLFGPRPGPAKVDDGKGLNIEALPTFGAVAVSDGVFTLDVRDEERFGTLHAEVDGLGLDITGGGSSIEIRALIAKTRVLWAKQDDAIDEEMTSLSFRAGVSSHNVDLRYLTANAGGAALSLRDGRAPIPLWPRGPSATEVSVSVPLDALNRLPLDLPGLRGSAAFGGQVAAAKNKDGKLELTLRGHVGLEDAAVDEFVIGDLAGFVSMTPKGLAFDETELNTAEGRIRLKGSVAFDERLTTDLSLQLERIELAALLEQLTVGNSFHMHKTSGNLKLRGHLSPFSLEGSADLDVADLVVSDGGFRTRAKNTILSLPKGHVRGRVAVTDTYLLCSDLLVSFGKTAIGVNARFDFPTASWWLAAKSDDFYLGDVGSIAGFQISGHGPLECRIEGPLSEPRIKGSTTMSDFSFADFAVSQVKTEVLFSDLVLGFSGLTVKTRQSGARADELFLDFSKPSGLRVTTRLASDGAELGDLAHVFHIDTAQFGSPSGRFKGKMALDWSAKPEHLSAEIDGALDRLEVFGERFGGGKVSGTYKDGEVVVSELSLTKGQGTVSVTGGVGRDRALNFVAVASQVGVDAIDNAAVKKLDLRTQAQVFAVLEGTFDHPRGRANVRLSETRRKKASYGPSAIELTLDGDQLQGRGVLAGEAVVLEHLQLDLAARRFLVEAFVRDVDIVRLLDFDTKGQRVVLSLEGELSLAGNLSGDPDLGGHASFNLVRTEINDFKFRNEMPLEIQAVHNRFEIGRTRFSGANVVFDIGGGLSRDGMDLKLDGLAALKAIAELVDGIEKSDGTLKTQLKLRGPLDKPLLSGVAEVNDASVSIEGFPYGLNRIKGRIVMRDRLVRFEEFEGRAAGGNVRASGELRIPSVGSMEYRFVIAAHDIEATPLEDLTFKASTTRDGLILRSGRDGKLPSLVGDVEVRSLRWTDDIRIVELSDLTVDRLTGTQRRALRPKVIDAAKDSFTFDVRLHGERDLEAHNNIFDANLRIDDVQQPLRLVGTNQSFGFLGRVFGSKGQVRFAGKRFEIRQATVDFRDPVRPDNPSFRVTADGQIRDWKITLTAEGAVDEYEIKFAAQPALSTEDVVFLILTGLTQAEYRQLGGAGISLGTPILGALGPGGESIPVEVQVYNEYSETAGTDTTRVALGRWITPDVWVSVSSALGQSREVEANIDYKIDERFAVTAGYENDNEGQVGNVGLDLKFRLEF